MAKKAPALDTNVLQNLEPIAKALQKGAAELWKIFVMRYIAKGISQIFLALVITGFSHMLIPEAYMIWMIVPLLVSSVLVYDAIQLLVNPYYFAMNDVVYRLKNEHLFGDK